MRKSILIGTLSGLVLCGTAAVAEELIPNGGFELQEGNSLAGWNPGQTIAKHIANTTAGAKSSGSVRYVWDTSSHGDGRGSLRLESLDLCEHAFGIVDTGLLDLKPEAEYRLVFWYRAQGLVPWDAKKPDCPLIVDVFFQHGPEPGSKFLSNKRVYIKDDASDWKKVETVFKTPAGADRGDVRLQLGNGIPNHQATIWFDDVSLQPTAAEAGTAAKSAPTNWIARTAVQTVAATHEDYSLVPPAIPYGSRIPRTMKLLATSTPQHRNRVKILFYGQSIIAQDWWKPIVAGLRTRYPNADIVAENPSIGGFTADLLKDTMYADCYPANADLICFHDYGPDTDLEAMFADMRRLTTAEVMPFTHHVAGQPQWMGMHGQQSINICMWADKYGYEVVDVRPTWKQILEKNELQPSFFLKDIIHLNPAGEDLWWKITMPHFQCRLTGQETWHDMIRVYTGDGKRFTADAKREYPDSGMLLAEPLKIAFDGSRVDLLADPKPGVKLGTARIMIDGKAPSSFPALYYVTRGSRPPNFFQPMLRRAQVGQNPVVEDWTLTFSNISTNGEDFNYEVRGSVTGPDGKGNAKEKFVSRSGRLIIEPQWFHMEALVKGSCKGVPYKNGTTCTFATRANFLDVWRPEPPAANVAATNPPAAWNGFGPVLAAPRQAGSEDRYTLASGLANGPHTLEIIPNNDGDLPLRAVVVHQPPVM